MASNDTLAKLAACPFCGGEAFEVEDGHIECESCGASMFCAASWNERAPLTAQALPAAEPFGYFKAEPFGWTDCAETDDGAIALYERPQAAQQAAQATAGWREQHDRDSAELRSLCQSRDEARRERDLCRVEIAGLNSSVGHMSALVDHQTSMLAMAMLVMKTLHAAATPDDSNEDMDAIIPGADFAKFVDGHARLLHLAANSPVAALPQPQPQSAQAKGDAA